MLLLRSMCAANCVGIAPYVEIRDVKIMHRIEDGEQTSGNMAIEFSGNGNRPVPRV
jgi:hypothetical protein